MYCHSETSRQEPGVIRSEPLALPALGIVWAAGEVHASVRTGCGGSELLMVEHPAVTQSSRWTDGTLPAGVRAGKRVQLRRPSQTPCQTRRVR